MTLYSDGNNNNNNKRIGMDEEYADELFCYNKNVDTVSTTYILTKKGKKCN